MPFLVNAGITSVFSNVFQNSPSKASVPGVLINSQTMPLLESALNSNPNPSRGGGEVTIVSSSALEPQSSPSMAFVEGSNGANSAGQISIYVVRQGDSLSQIADMFNVSTNTIVWANDIKGHIKEGQVLVILPMTGVRHVVTVGDTIESIAKKYSGEVENILDYNRLPLDAKLAVGDIIDIPDGEIPAPAPRQAPTRTAGVSQGSNASAGFYMRPIRGGVRTQGIHGFNAVDLAAPTGTSIFASASGEVMVSRNSGWNGGYGNYVVIAHANGSQTLYAHMSSNIVSPGQRVAQGQVIGYVGSTGQSTGPHLHFEIRGGPRNPF